VATEEEKTFTLVEGEVPLAGITGSAAELVEMFGGGITEEVGSEIRFNLPVRRGVPSSGIFNCLLQWAGNEANSGSGELRLTADHRALEGGARNLAVLIAGALGASVWILWPFFPNLGPLAWVGGLIAFCAYFLTLRRTSGGIAHDFMQRLVGRQREVSVEGDDLEDEQQ